MFIRLGLPYMGTAPGTLVSLISGLMGTLAITAVVQPGDIAAVSGGAVLWFALVGLFNFPFGRFFNYLSVARLGVARSTPLLSTGPFFAVSVSVAFLGEQLTPLTVLGMVLITAGIYIAISERSDGATPAGPAGAPDGG